MHEPVGPVDILWGLDLIAGRAAAAGADFILAGPVSLWLRGLTPPPREPRFILITSEASVGPLLRALSLSAARLGWGPEWGSVEGLAARLLLRGYIIEVVVDPVIDGEKFMAARLARESDHVVIGKYVIRLAPTWFEYRLADALAKNAEPGEDPTS